MDAAAILGITDYLERKPKALSGGQRQRVAVGRAIVRQPSVFLFDEPLSNLDAKMRVQMRAEITKLHKRLQATMIYVTHDQVEAMTMGERIVVMKDGIVQQVAAPMEIYNEPANLFVAGFLGSPPMNFIQGRLRADGSDFLFEEKGTSLVFRIPSRPSLAAQVGKPTTLGVRPEHCHWVPKPDGVVENRFEATVEIIEPMGAETFLYLTTGPHQMVSRIHDVVNRAEAGHRLTFELETARVHLFDTDSGLRLA
jgi:multiple sugar transport system ATP-binding protein